jgi:hypothetical protein
LRKALRNPRRFVICHDLSSSYIPPQIFSSEVRHNLATDLDIVDEKKADLLFEQAEQISDEEAEEIMREVLEEHRHSTSPM